MKSVFKISSFILVASSLVTSCSSPESYQQKMARYTPKATDGKNLVPEFQLGQFEFNLPKKSRAPASIASEQTTLDEAKESNPTNKKLYFLALYSQYEQLKQFGQDFIGPDVSICPSFHTSLTKFKEKQSSLPRSGSTKKLSYNVSRMSEDSYLAKRPELLLPLSKDEATPRVIDIVRNGTSIKTEQSVSELVHKAIDIHLAKTYTEIKELCEYGSSDNYYVYENLITHIKNTKFEADNTNLNVLLKTTLFSNMALMTSLDNQSSKPTTGRSIASTTKATDSKLPYSQELFTRLNVSWANQYYDYIKANR
jgi:hypothetical protein